MSLRFFRLTNASALASIPLFLTCFASTAQSSRTVAPAIPHAPRARVEAAYGKVPLSFEPNRGQTSSAVKFLARGQGYNIFLQSDVVTLALHKTGATQAERQAAALADKNVSVTEDTIRMQLVGGSPTARMTGEKSLPGYVNYISGADRSKWSVGLPTYAATRVSGAYPGIDLIYYGTERQLEYDFVVAPGADAAQVKLSLQGATPVLEADGELRLRTVAGTRGTDMVFRKPVVYQQDHGTRQPVDAAFAIAASGEVSFKLGAYDRARELVIDPIISYASYFGGAGEDEINGSAVNASNQLYAVGQTFSTSLPATAGEFETGPAANNNGHDAFVTKFSADGSTILWTTYLSGSGDDFATSVAVNGSDQAYVVGYTASCGSGGTSYATAGEFPFTADAVQSLCNPSLIGFNNYESNGGNYDVFLSKLSSDGTQLLYSTPLGGSNNDVAQSVVLDASGKAYIVGETNSTGYLYAVASNQTDVPSYPINNHGVPALGYSNYPTTANAFYSNTTESRQYATVDGQGNTVGPTDEQAFITVLSADLHTIVYSSLLGGGIIGGCGNGACNTNGLAIAVNSNNIAYIGGNTSSAHWPVTAGAFAPACSNAGTTSSQCPMTGWLAAFDATKSGSASLLFNTYINGTSSGQDSNGNNQYPASDVFGLTTDSAGNVILTGDTNANNFPTTAGTVQPACVTFRDGGGHVNVCEFGPFVAKLSATGSTVWSTYLGATSPDISVASGRGVAVDVNNNVYVLAQTNTAFLPTKNSLAPAEGSQDAYLAELSPTASAVLMGTYLGTGGGVTVNNSLHLDSNLNAYFSGYQGVNPYGGTSFPVSANAPGKTIQGGYDGFVVKLITQQQASATALVIAPNPATPTQTVTITATVTTPSTLTGSALPTGSVVFMNGTAVIGTKTLNASGVATFTGTFPAANYSITANYSGDAGFSSSVSGATTLSVSGGTVSTTTLTATPTAAKAGGTVTLMATAAGTGGTPTGTVVFLDGTTPLGTATLAGGSATYTTTTLSSATHTITARYSGDTVFATSTSAAQTVTVTANVVGIGLAASPSVALPGSSITLTATLSGAGTTAPTGTVTFNDGTTVIGMVSVAGGTATLKTTTLSTGTHNITATYSGDSLYAAVGTTGATAQTIVIRTAVASSTTLSSSGASVSFGSSVTFTATIASAATSGLPTGTVTFLDGTTTLGSGTVTSGVATFTTTLAIGTHSITANYSGDTLFLASNSTAFTQTVAAATIALSATPASLTITHGSTGTTTITVTPMGTYTGALTFSCGALPSYASCAFAPATLAFTASSASQSTTLTINTKSTTSAVLRSEDGLFSNDNKGQILAGAFFLPLGLLGLAARRRGKLSGTGLLMLAFALSFGVVGLSGCGGGASTPTVATGSYTIPVIAAANGSTTTLNFNVTVQ